MSGSFKSRKFCVIVIATTIKFLQLSLNATDLFSKQPPNVFVEQSNIL